MFKNKEFLNYTIIYVLAFLLCGVILYFSISHYIKEIDLIYHKEIIDSDQDYTILAETGRITYSPAEYSQDINEDKLSLFVSCYGIFAILGVAGYILGLKLYKIPMSAITTISQSSEDVLEGDYNTPDFSNFTEGDISQFYFTYTKMVTAIKQSRDKELKEKEFLQDLIADISHQLKTPLTSINLILSLLQASDITEERRNELLRELSSLITKTEYLVSVLLKLSRLDAGTVKFEKKENVLSRIIEKAAEPILIPMDIKNQKLITEVGNISLNCDYGWCIEAFGNILKNCAEHTPENGVVTVRAADTPIYTEIIISDTGNGFDEEDIPHLFERFYKGKSSSKDSFGIGLNLAGMIISAHNGKISAENAPSGGAKFTIRFYKQIV